MRTTQFSFCAVVLYTWTQTVGWLIITFGHRIISAIHHPHFLENTSPHFLLDCSKDTLLICSLLCCHLAIFLLFVLLFLCSVPRSWAMVPPNNNITGIVIYSLYCSLVSFCLETGNYYTRWLCSKQEYLHWRFMNSTTVTQCLLSRHCGASQAIRYSQWAQVLVLVSVQTQWNQT